MLMKTQCLQSTIKWHAIKQAVTVVVQEAFPNYFCVICNAEWSLLKAVHPENVLNNDNYWKYSLLNFLSPFYNHKVFFKNNEKFCQLLRTQFSASIFMGSSGVRERFLKGNPIVPLCLWQEPGIFRQLAWLQTQSVPGEPQVCLENTVHGDFLEQLLAHDSGLRSFPVSGAMT